MSAIEELRPAQRGRLIDLVRLAGMDVTEWAAFAGGPARAASNPKYCYEWAFIEPGGFVVLNMWHESFQEQEGRVFVVDNVRRTVEIHSQPGGKPQWARRAEAFDSAVQTALRHGLPVRVVICTGQRRKPDGLIASKVKCRSLDATPWAVMQYNDETGDFVAMRGEEPRPILVDQFELRIEDAGPTERRQTSGEQYIRSAEVRAHARRRASGCCEWCGTQGFLTPGGAIFLETHHIIPLSENGRDVVENVAALCPNHHREAHHGAKREVIRAGLLSRPGPLDDE